MTGVRWPRTSHSDDVAASFETISWVCWAVPGPVVCAQVETRSPCRSLDPPRHLSVDARPGLASSGRHSMQSACRAWRGPWCRFEGSPGTGRGERPTRGRRSDRSCLTVPAVCLEAILLRRSGGGQALFLMWLNVQARLGAMAHVGSTETVRGRIPSPFRSRSRSRATEPIFFFIFCRGRSPRSSPTTCSPWWSAASSARAPGARLLERRLTPWACRVQSAQ